MSALTLRPLVSRASRAALTSSRPLLYPRNVPALCKMASNMTAINSKDAAPPAGPYSHAIKTPSAIYCSGSIPVDSQGNLVEGTIQQKTEACIKNLRAVLAEAGSSLEKVVKVNIFLADMGDFASMNEEYAKHFTHKPARSCVAVKTLPKNVEVEIECIALP
ncbi:endoribonuclease L-PSP [Magnaporthiopsis poae ATCC 64411]|uniref:Endoribonuclease L-PSP n=1 Tax=Magnaporthiopsis poae (strain ATCC 64411 / 73-15) TaxID=644358 RepID=A0A0C4DTF0_MAGP6|nr:endoribonuclease L-PSP [Magnaporthiopsis poae ATCC 64411]